ncbi:hypothetical protein CDCA_CDCA03G0833 [Cyanidium caldarium]|uniref:GATA-type domain-containing protein n=1 Tax=Cyanidium caldarium TaxID=2771 RepID=A0AAV9IRC1_CYACA|nr:hypothetical protein CDCA_CDCA03G0833 [Cyanidium caldarium]
MGTGGSLRCVSCSTTDTPLWRAGPTGAKTLCNACGVKWKKGKLSFVLDGVTHGVSALAGVGVHGGDSAGYRRRLASGGNGVARKPRSGSVGRVGVGSSPAWHDDLEVESGRGSLAAPPAVGTAVSPATPTLSTVAMRYSSSLPAMSVHAVATAGVCKRWHRPRKRNTGHATAGVAARPLRRSASTASLAASRSRARRHRERSHIHSLHHMVKSSPASMASSSDASVDSENDPLGFAAMATDMEVDDDDAAAAAALDALGYTGLPSLGVSGTMRARQAASDDLEVRYASRIFGRSAEPSELSSSCSTTAAWIAAAAATAAPSTTEQRSENSDAGGRGEAAAPNGTLCCEDNSAGLPREERMVGAAEHAFMAAATAAAGHDVSMRERQGAPGDAATGTSRLLPTAATSSSSSLLLASPPRPRLPPSPPRKSSGGDAREGPGWLRSPPRNGPGGHRWAAAPPAATSAGGTSQWDGETLSDHELDAALQLLASLPPISSAHHHGDDDDDDNDGGDDHGDDQPDGHVSDGISHDRDTDRPGGATQLALRLRQPHSRLAALYATCVYRLSKLLEVLPTEARNGTAAAEDSYVRAFLADQASSSMCCAGSTAFLGRIDMQRAHALALRGYYYDAQAYRRAVTAFRNVYSANELNGFRSEDFFRVLAHDACMATAGGFPPPPPPQQQQQPLQPNGRAAMTAAAAAAAPVTETLSVAVVQAATQATLRQPSSGAQDASTVRSTA